MSGITAQMVMKEGVGGARRDRTADLVIANDALSQLSYGPVGRWVEPGNARHLQSGPTPSQGLRPGVREG